MRDNLAVTGANSAGQAPSAAWTHVLHDVTDVLASARGLLEAAPSVLRALGEWLGCDRVSLWTLESGNVDAPLQCARTWGRDAAGAAAAAPPSEGSVGGEGAVLRRAVTMRAPVAQTGASSVLKALRTENEAPSPSSLLSIPIVYGDSVYGVVALCRDAPFDAPDVDLVAAATLGSELGQFVARESALRDLLRSRRELADVFEHAPVGLHLMDATGRILRVNRTELEMLGYTRDELLGTLWRDLHVDRSDADDLLARLTRVGEGPRDGGVRDAEARLRCKNGSVKWVRVDANVLRDEDEFVHVRTFVRDVTATKAAEVSVRASEERYRRLIEGTREYGLHALDADGRVTGWSEGAQRLYGYAESEVLGRDFSITFREEDRADGAPSRMVRLAADEGELRHEGPRVRKDGSTFWAEVVYTALRDPDGRLIGISQLTRDVTERRRNESLRRERADFEAANREVLESSRRGAQLLRSVVTAVSGPVEKIAQATAQIEHEQADGGSAPDSASLIAGVAALFRALAQLEEAAIAAPASPASEPKPVELLRLAVETKDLLREAAAERRVRVDVDVDPSLADVVADTMRLRQVLYNLLSNAVESSRERGRVALRILPEGDTRFRIEAEDSGIGIADRALPHVFDAPIEPAGPSEGEPSAPVDAPSAESPGDAESLTRSTSRALGLAATKRLVEDQGGRVAAQSTLGRGSVFVAVLPRTPSSAKGVEAHAADEAAPSEERAKSVLVVSEDSATRAAVSWTLGHLGVEAVAAPQGEQGLDLIRARRFDAIAVDFLLGSTLGGMSAVDFVATLRGEGRNRDVACILVAVGTGAAGASCLAVDDLLPRPAPADRLLAALESAGTLREKGRSVVVVDGDLRQLDMLKSTLATLGVDAVAEPAGDAALRACAERTPSAVLLSTSIHGMDPFEFLRHLRLMPALVGVPVILLIPRKLEDAEVDSLREAAAASTEDFAWARAIRADGRRRRTAQP